MEAEFENGQGLTWPTCVPVSSDGRALETIRSVLGHAIQQIEHSSCITISCKVDREHVRSARDTISSAGAIEVDRSDSSWTSITGRRSGAIGGVTSSSLDGDFLGG